MGEKTSRRRERIKIEEIKVSGEKRARDSCSEQEGVVQAHLYGESTI